jgi:alkylation response protein AidB-like acyl-CoA dehydrogenase
VTNTSVRTQLVPPALTSGFEYAALRAEVRAFIAEQAEKGGFAPVTDSWGGGWDPAFTTALARRGWVGMTIPRAYGGAGRSFVERFVVTEELLAAGCPVSAHWVADRQAGPSLLRYGTQEQRDHYLPKIVRGEIYWAIGMSEPSSGSDLASVRTRATRVDGGWSITGTKLWTSGAHQAHVFFVLARTAPQSEGSFHDGLSQFIIPLDAPGIRISPVLNMAGEHHFNEVHLDSVHVPDSQVLGEIGDGWAQVTSELGYERSGPERFLSTFQLLRLTAEQERSAGTPDARIGAAVGRLFGLHNMSMAVAGALQRDEKADVAAAVVKLLGTRLEGDVVDVAEQLAGIGSRDEGYQSLLRGGVMSRPGFTLRGGSTEILRGVIARGLGLR